MKSKVEIVRCNRLWTSVAIGNYQRLSTEYKEIQNLSLKNQADLLEQQFKNANGGNTTFDKDAWIASKQRELDLKELSDKASYYSQLTNYEEEYRNKKLEWIDKEQERLAQFYEDDLAAAQWATQEKVKLEYELFKKKTDYVSQGFGDLSSAFDGISKLYAEGSKDAENWKKASDAMLIAQRAVAVVQAVAASYQGWAILIPLLRVLLQWGGNGALQATIEKRWRWNDSRKHNIRDG
jgi:hypothetical protein